MGVVCRPVGGGYGGNRFRRDDDRLRNLPNRLRNKRNEEIGQSGAGPLVGGATTDRTDKESDPRKDSTGKPLRQQVSGCGHSVYGRYHDNATETTQSPATAEVGLCSCKLPTPPHVYGCSPSPSSPSPCSQRGG